MGLMFLHRIPWDSHAFVVLAHWWPCGATFRMGLRWNLRRTPIRLPWDSYGEWVLWDFHGEEKAQCIWPFVQVCMVQLLRNIS